MEILFEPFPKQEEFMELAFDNEHSVALYGGAIRGGKSFVGFGTLILYCLAFPGSRWAIVRKDLPTIKRNTLPGFKKICPDGFCKGNSYDKAFNQQTGIFTAKNGSEILFFPENYTQDKELNRWKGLEVNGFLLEEANELQEDSFWKAIERAGSWIIPGGVEQPPPKVLMTCNPSQNWVKQLLYDPWKFGNLRKGWAYIPADMEDNPYNSEEYKKSLRNLPERKYQVFVKGNWDIKLRTGAEFYPRFDVDKNLKLSVYDPRLPLHLSFDENVNPYLPVTIWQAKGRKLWQIDEICLKRPRNKLKTLCQAIEARYKRHKSGVFIYGDATSRKEDVKIEEGQDFFKLAKKYLAKFKPVLRIPKSNPSVVMRANFINALFNGEIEGCELIIGDNCPFTIGDMENVLEDSDGRKLKIKEKDPETGITFEPYGHTSDSMDYIAIHYFRREYRRFQGGASGSDPRSIGRLDNRQTY